MTENEAIIRFEFIRCALLAGTKPHIVPNEENIALIDVAIKALKEVQQYREIGTPEECRAAMEKQPVFNMDKVVEQLQKISDEAHDLIMVSDSPQYYDGYEDGVDKAIDIVKAGGVDGKID